MVMASGGVVRLHALEAVEAGVLDPMGLHRSSNPVASIALVDQRTNKHIADVDGIDAELKDAKVIGDTEEDEEDSSEDEDDDGEEDIVMVEGNQEDEDDEGSSDEDDDEGSRDDDDDDEGSSDDNDEDGFEDDYDEEDEPPQKRRK